MSDSVLKQRLPVVILLVVIAVTTFLDWTFTEPDIFTNPFGYTMVPDNVVKAWENALDGDFSGRTLFDLSTTLTSGFLHADMSHLCSNLLFLWLFGVVINDLCKWRWMTAAFLITTIGGSIGQTLLDPQSPIPSLGASGGLMGFMGFYMGLALQHPRPDSHVWPLARPVTSTQLAAAGIVSIFFDFMGIADGVQGIAFGAHIGGFATGIILSIVADRFVS